MKLELNPEELKILERVVEMYSSELRVEIQHTDNPEFRSKLKEEKMMLAGLLGRLKNPQGMDRLQATAGH